MHCLSLTDLHVQGKKVLMRVDFNVPLSEHGDIVDDSRIVAALKSIRYLLSHHAALILMSHVGRPHGTPDSRYSLAPIAQRLSQLLKQPVTLLADCIGPAVEKACATLAPGQVILLENLRFHAEEEEPEKDPLFAKQLASLGDVYVNDAFGTAHRAHSSTSFIAKYFPGKAAVGFLVQKELDAFLPLLTDPERPFYAIIGGSKVSSKAGIIQNLLKRVDGLFLGGGMTYTFLKAQGIPVGDSLVEDGELKTAQTILTKSSAIYLPSDLMIADAFSNDATWKVIDVQEGIPAGWQGMGIGPKTVEHWAVQLQKAALVFWNGPLGVCEMPTFAKTTVQMAQRLAALDAKVIIGGGDSLAMIHQAGLGSQFSHLSTGGGAALELLEFGHLPGIDALSSGTVS